MTDADVIYVRNSLDEDVQYPDSDGQPMSDNTLQFDWIGLVKWAAEAYFRNAPDVFVAGDHLIYPVEGDPAIRLAPDVYVSFGRPKGYRGSYQVWREAGVFPQVVFEVWSPRNRPDEMDAKRAFYDGYGAEEYYLLYPEFPAYAEGWVRGPGGALDRVPDMNGFTSPRLGFRFTLAGGELTIHGPDGRRLLRPDEVARERDEAEQARTAAERELAAADAARREAEARAERLAARLRELGVDPDAVG